MIERESLHFKVLTMNRGFQVLIGIVFAAPIGVTIWPAFSQLTVASEDSVNIEENTASESFLNESTTEENVVETAALAFACHRDQGVPMTVAQTSAATVPIVRWDRTVIAIETTPQLDCETSAAQFQTAYDNGLLSYITTGRMNGQLVACAADTVSGRCLSRLLGLRATQRPRVALQQILQIRLPTEGPIADTGPRPYVELDRYLSGGYDSVAAESLNTPPSQPGAP